MTTTTKLEERVLHLEYQVESYGERLDVLDKTGEVLTASLDEMKKALLQIKWIAMGAGATYLITNLGLVPALKVLL